MHNTMNNILTAPDKHQSKTYGGNGVLSRLWRLILLDLRVGPVEFGNMLHEYITNPINGVAGNRKAQISHRGNLTKEFARPQMTWKVFIKGLRFLNILKVRITLELYYSNTRTRTVFTDINLGGRYGAHLFNEALEQPEEMEAIIPVECLDKEIDTDDLYQEVSDGTTE